MDTLGSAISESGAKYLVLNMHDNWHTTVGGSPEGIVFTSVVKQYLA
jgi:hypothetical protein